MPRCARFVAAMSVCLLFVPPAGAQEEGPPAKFRYDGWKFVEVEIRGARDLLALNQVGENMACTPRPGPQTYLIPPGGLEALDAIGLPYRVTSGNVQDVIDAEEAAREAARAERGPGFFVDYQPVAQINAYMDTLIALRPDLASSVTVGTTVESRPIKGIRITGPAVTGEPPRPAVIINAGQHAREWVAPSTAMWAMDQLIRTYDTDAEVRELVDRIVWIIIPSANPDGYEYSRNSVRLWRKNRRNNGDGTFGVDLNRNYGYQWGGASTSSSGSSDIYRGPFAFSEPESQAFRDFCLATPNLKGVIDLHSYSQLIFGPWGYSHAVMPPRAAEYYAIGDDMGAAVNSTHGVIYAEGLGPDELIYEAAGVLPDWTFDATGALSWTIELRDTGTFGFTLPPSQIVPVGQEIFNGLKRFGRGMLLRLVLSIPTPPGAATFGQPVSFGVNVLPMNGHTVAPGGAKLFWRVGSSGAFAETPLEGAAPSCTATLPGTIPCGATVEYYAEAIAEDATVVRFPADAPASRLAFSVQNITEVLNDTLEGSGAGWIAGMPGDTATTGQWVLVDPVGTSAQPEDDHTPGAGVKCFVTGQGVPGGSLGAQDVDNGFTTLVTPRFDLAGASAATVSYWRWYSNAGGNDAFQVDISNNDGASWTGVETVGPAGPGTSGGWILKVFDPATILPLTADMRLRFIARDDAPGQVVEAAIDDFLAVKSNACPPPACPGDADGDGAVGLADIAAIISAWGEAASPPGSGADVDGSGDVGLGDIASVITHWGSSCP